MVADSFDQVSAKSLLQKCFGDRWPPQPSSLDLRIKNPSRHLLASFGDNLDPIPVTVRNDRQRHG
jgi:hypothetical protein